MLIAMTVVCIVPAWLGMAALIQAIYHREYQRDVQSTIIVARALALAVDRELASAQTAAEMLAAHPYLVSGDLAAFHREAGRLVVGRVGDNVVVSDASGRQLVNTIVPFGDKLGPHNNPKQFARVLATGEAAISGVFIGGVLRQPVMAIEVPVFDGSDVRYVLSVGIFPERMRELLIGQELPPGWVASILDSSGVVAARTRSPEQFVGRKAVSELVEAMGVNREGTLRTHTLEGTPVYAAYSRSGISNWTVAVGIPVAEVVGGLYLFLGLSAAGTLVVLGLGIGLAIYQSARIACAVRSLIAPALALGRGEAPSIELTQIREANDVAQALANAFDLLQHRTNERDRAEHDKQVAEGAAYLKSEFVATVSHEMRTPLTAIAASLGLIAGTANGDLSESVKRLIMIAHANTQRLVRLVNDILDIEKLEADKVVFDLQHVAVEPLVEHAIEVTRPWADSCGVRLRMEQSSTHAVCADPHRLMQVLANLLSNAIKFTPPDGEVTVAVAKRGDQVRISVTDQGPGIPGEFRPQVFAKFAQASSAEAGQLPGTGLGLSIVKQIIVRLGGAVGFADAPGRGTIFYVDLPCLAPEDFLEDGEPVFVDDDAARPFASSYATRQALPA